ncbi:MAG: histidinol-phosphatase [Bacteroidales bacterium]|nr:histidinol-phosphatase [Bacteroidales bacterium]
MNTLNKQGFWILLLFFLFILGSANSQQRKDIKLPDIEGYKTLKCDFHIHTIFSDALVWPTIRVEEAYREGLDAIAITDHVEYKPYKKYVDTSDLNISYNIAKSRADYYGLIIIKGAEITRNLPLGHSNALFLNDINPLKEGYPNMPSQNTDAYKAANKQGAYIFWNHPGFMRPDNIGQWTDAQETLYKEGFIKGIEVVNGKTFYPEGLRFAKEKNLTFFGNTDIHNPITFNYNFNIGQHRTMTLVFAKDKTQEAIKEALLAGRTAVYFGDTLFGNDKYLKQIFYNSVKQSQNDIKLKGKGKVVILISNNSDLSYYLKRVDNEDINIPGSLYLPAGKSVIMSVSSKITDKDWSKNIKASYQVTNLINGPDEYTNIDFPIKIEYKKE